MKTAIGIDLGTTFCAVAAIRDGNPPVILRNANDEPTTPSIIYFPENGEPVAGSDAEEYRSLGDTNFAAFFKRHMGDPSFFMEFHGKSYSAIDLSAIMLGKLKKDAEDALGEPVRDVVITVPAYFNNIEREATKKAAEQAGLNVIRLIHEPTAAAIAYGFNNAANSNKKILVYDLGGGTFDVSLIETSPNEIRVIGTDGDHMLGGKDLDDRMSRLLSEKFCEENGIDLLDDPESAFDLLARSEKAKKELSKKEETTVRITHGGISHRIVVTREQFNAATTDLLSRTMELSENVLKAVNPPLSWDDIDGVLLVGGSSRIPAVEELVLKKTGKKPLRGINVDEAVATGAAIQAASDLSSFELETTGAPLTLQTTIRDVIGHSLGMVAESADRSRYVNQKIIPKNSPIPCTFNKSSSLRVSASQNNELEVYMLQGESDVPIECTILGKYVFSGLEVTPSGKALIDIFYSYNQNGVVDVRAIQLDNQKPLLIRVEPVPEDMSWLERAPSDITSVSHPEVAVVFVVDTSGSMFDDSYSSDLPIEKAQDAIREFMTKINLEHFSIGIGAFGDSSRILQRLTKKRDEIDKAVKKLSKSYLRGTNAVPFDMARSVLKGHKGPSYIVLLTDGEWFQPERAIYEAQKCAKDGIEIIAVGIGDADINFLKKLATCDDNALFADLSQLSTSFSKIAQVLSESPTGSLSLDESDDSMTSNPRHSSRKGIFSFFKS